MTWKRKSLSNLSNAFSWSKVTMYPRVTFWLSYEIRSLVRKRFSLIVLPGTRGHLLILCSLYTTGRWVYSFQEQVYPIFYIVMRSGLFVGKQPNQHHVKGYRGRPRWGLAPTTAKMFCKIHKAGHHSQGFFQPPSDLVPPCKLCLSASDKTLWILLRNMFRFPWFNPPSFVYKWAKYRRVSSIIFSWSLTMCPSEFCKAVIDCWFSLCANRWKNCFVDVSPGSLRVVCVAMCCYGYPPILLDVETLNFSDQFVYEQHIRVIIGPFCL